MAISSPGFVVARLRDSSSISESPMLSMKLKSVLKNGVSNFMQNPILRTRGRNALTAKLKSATSDNLGKTVTVTEVFDSKPDRESGGGDDGNGNSPPGNGGNGGGDEGGGGGNEDDHEEKEFGPLMKFDEVMKVAETQGVNLPPDMLEAAKATGLRKLILTRYMDLQVKEVISI